MARRNAMEKEAFRLYRKGVIQKEIAAKCGVSEQTVSSWKRKYGWEERIEAEAVSINTSINTLRKKFNDWVASIDEYDTGISDAALKHAKTMALLDDSVDPLASTIMVMDAFAGFIEMHHSELYTTFQEVLPGFLQHMRNKADT